MEYQENLEIFLVFKTNNHLVSMEVVLGKSFQIGDEVHCLLASYVVSLNWKDILARKYYFHSNSVMFCN